MLTSVGEGRAFFVHIFGKGAGARGGDGGERGQSFNKTKIFNKRSLRSLVMLAAHQERSKRGEHCGVTLQLSF